MSQSACSSPGSVFSDMDTDNIPELDLTELYVACAVDGRQFPASRRRISVQYTSAFPPQVPGRPRSCPPRQAREWEVSELPHPRHGSSSVDTMALGSPPTASPATASPKTPTAEQPLVQPPVPQPLQQQQHGATVVAEASDLEVDVSAQGVRAVAVCSLESLVRWVCNNATAEWTETVALTYPSYTTQEALLYALMDLYKRSKGKDEGVVTGVLHTLKAIADLGFESQTPHVLKLLLLWYEFAGDVRLRWTLWSIIRSLYAQAFQNPEMIKLVAAMQDPKTGVFLRANQKKSFFTGQELFDWMQDVAGVSHEDAKYLGEEMVRRGFIKSAFKSEGLLPNANLYFPTFALPLSQKPATPLSIADCSMTELAEQLCLREQALFKSIRISEFRGCAWMKANKQQTSPNILEMIHFSNKISYWVATEVVCSPDPRRRLEVLRKSISLAQHCYDNNCFSAVAEILGGLQHVAVRRLRTSWMALPYKYRQMLHEMLVLMQPDDNSKNYRACIRQKLKTATSTHNSNFSVVPHLGVYLTDITFVETNQDSVRGLINFRKMRMLGAILREVHLFQHGTYEFRFKDELQEILAHSTLCPSSDEELSVAARFNESAENPFFNQENKSWDPMGKLSDLLAALPVPGRK